jgi:AbiV family abortive infection protein
LNDADETWWSAVEAALAVGPPLAPTTETFNFACEHIACLLKESSLLLDGGSAATSCFLSITALEETAKVHLGMYRRSDEAVSRGRDPLHQHKEKHLIAAAPTILMGSRLQAAIGEERAQQITMLARSAGLVRLRESCLYLEQHGIDLILPSNVVAAPLARELLLFAIEAFDDALVGYTNQSFTLGSTTDEIFAKWAGGATLAGKV